MGIWSQTIAAIRPLAVFVAVAPLAVAETSDGESYFMQARVTRVHFDRTIDFWVLTQSPCRRYSSREFRCFPAGSPGKRRPSPG